MKYAFVIAACCSTWSHGLWPQRVSTFTFFPNPPVPGLAAQLMEDLFDSLALVITFERNSSAARCCSATATCRSH